MDTELARTFLAIVSAGNFVATAEKLHVAQSTVSARSHQIVGSAPGIAVSPPPQPWSRFRQ